MPHRHPLAARQMGLAALLVALLTLPPLSSASALAATAVSGSVAMRGFFAMRSASALDAEARLLDVLDRGRIADWARRLAQQPRIAGTDRMKETADWVAERFGQWGLEVEIDTHDVYLPHALSVAVERLNPDPSPLSLREDAVSEDPDSAAPLYPAANGYSAAGDVRGSVIYANYGRAEDFDALSASGVSVDGKVVLMRYGRVFRGVKARNAEAAGAVAVLLYSDPLDDGFFRGDVYPNGPFRPWSGLQRGSVRWGAPGDPAPSTVGLPPVGREINHSSVPTGVPDVPVVSLSYGSALELLKFLGGPGAPNGWQGALPLRYHLGPGPVEARVAVVLDEAPRKSIWNVVGKIVGSDFPDEWVIVGAHRDSWSHGANDNASGTASLLEAARAAAQMAREGSPPRRTLLFASWDAEEWGLIGSADRLYRVGRTARQRAGSQGRCVHQPGWDRRRAVLRHPGNSLVALIGT